MLSLIYATQKRKDNSIRNCSSKVCLRNPPIQELPDRATQNVLKHLVWEFRPRQISHCLTLTSLPSTNAKLKMQNGKWKMKKNRKPNLLNHLQFFLGFELVSETFAELLSRNLLLVIILIHTYISV